MRWSAAIETGMVDWVLPTSDMPKRVEQYRASGARLRLPPEEGPQPAQAVSANEAGVDEHARTLESPPLLGQRGPDVHARRRWHGGRVCQDLAQRSRIRTRG